MEPLRLLEWRLSFRSCVRFEREAEIVPLRWTRGSRIWWTLLLKHTMPRQSHGANGVVGSQPSMEPRGSSRFCLNAVRASISDTLVVVVTLLFLLSAHVNVKVVKYVITTIAMELMRNIAVVAMRVVEVGVGDVKSVSVRERVRASCGFWLGLVFVCLYCN